MCPTGCKWSSLNAKDTKIPESPPSWVHFTILLSQGANLPIFSHLILISQDNFVLSLSNFSQSAYSKSWCLNLILSYGIVKWELQNEGQGDEICLEQNETMMGDAMKVNLLMGET